MTRTRTDRVKVHAYTLRYWWNSLTAWDQVLIGAALVCIFELAVLRAAYPWLERWVIS